jgi:integrase/recombinase XerD
MQQSLPPLNALLDDWIIDLKGQRKSPHTLAGYRTAVTSFLTYCAEQRIPAELTKANVVGYMANVQCQSSTARLHLTVLKLFARWLAAEEGLEADPILTIKHPRTDEKIVPNLTADEVTRLIKACDGPMFKDKRDKAALVLLAETGLRAGELVALDVEDVDRMERVLRVRRGKGGRGRPVKFSPECAAQIGKYLRARRQAGLPAETGPMFVNQRGQGRLTYHGLAHSLRVRAADADVKHFHIHRLRHTMAVDWVKKGGTESGLMAQAGWQSRTMVDRYIKSASEQLAAEEFDRLGIGMEWKT